MEWTRPAAASASRTVRKASVLHCFAACLVAGVSWLVPGAPPAAAQAAGSGASAALTVGEIMTGAEFRTRVPGDLRWLSTPGQAAYSALEPSTDSYGTDIVRYDAASGART